MIQLYHKITQLLSETHRMINSARRQNYDNLVRTLGVDFMPVYQLFLQDYIQLHMQEDYHDIQPGHEQYLQITGMLLKAQEQKDYVLLADYMELYLQPLFIETLAVIRSMFDVVEQVDYRPVNEAFFSLQKYNFPFTRQAASASYMIEPTEQGPFTILVKRDKESFYLHSNVNPWKEAEAWSEAYGDESAKEYVVLGLGLGYHAISLWKQAAGAIPVHIYEMNPEVIEAAKRYQDFSFYTRRGLFIHYDPELQQLTDKLKNDGTKLVIHYPSLRNISNRKIRDIFENFFVKDNSEKNQRRYLYANFHRNMTADIKPVENIKHVFEGKDVYIIAAGPSLDKNIESLMNKPSNSIMLATGTVLSKLLRMGIRPDYVIVSDANERIVKQIRSHNKCGIPMLLLSTAYYEFGQSYEAEKYILFQKDFEPAEQYAREHEHLLVETGGSVATVALDVSIRLKAGRIIFLGLDLAYTNNQAHASDAGNQLAGTEDDLIKVRAFDGGTVYADFKFNIYAQWIEKRLQQEDAGSVTVINATEGGRFIKGMQYMPLAVVMGTV